MRVLDGILVGAAVLVTAGTGVVQPAPPPVGGRLAEAVLLGGPPLTNGDMPEELSSSDRTRLLAYMDRWKAFKTRQGFIAGSLVTWKRRERLEREIVASIERPGIERIAHAIAWSQGPFGISSDPVEEAAWAESLVRDPANAPAATFLYGFLASRYRLQFEQAGDDRQTRERLARKYKTMLDRVRSGGDSLLVLLADDLDGRPSLGKSVPRHPRQYLPDS